MNKNNNFLREKGVITKKENINDYQVKLNRNNLLVKATIASRLKHEERRWKRLMEGDTVLVEIPFGSVSDLRGRIIKVYL